MAVNFDKSTEAVEGLEQIVRGSNNQLLNTTINVLIAALNSGSTAKDELVTASKQEPIEIRVQKSGDPSLVAAFAQYKELMDKASELFKEVSSRLPGANVTGIKETVKSSRQAVTATVAMLKNMHNLFTPEQQAKLTPILDSITTANATPTGSVFDYTKVREWATANGVTVNARGRLSREVIDAYEKENGPVPLKETSEETE